MALARPGLAPWEAAARRSGPAAGTAQRLWWSRLLLWRVSLVVLGYRSSISGHEKDYLSFEQFLKEAAYLHNGNRIFFVVTLSKRARGAASRGLPPQFVSPWILHLHLHLFRVLGQIFSILPGKSLSLLQLPGSCCTSEQRAKPSHRMLGLTL